MSSKFLVVGALSCFLLDPSWAAAAQGEDLFEAQCVACHAKDGSGSPAGKKLGVLDLRSPEVQSLSDEELFDGIAYGAKHKQYPHGFARRGLTDQQIKTLVSYIRTLHK